MRGRAIGSCCVLVLLCVFLGVAVLAETPAGSKGYSFRFPNSRYSYLYIDMANDSPNYNCHVAYVRDGSAPGGWGGAQMDTGGGNWVELRYCMYVDGAPRLRVNSWSYLRLVDPVDPAHSPAAGEQCDCGADIEPGAQVRAEGPEDPTFDWPPTYIGWGWGHAYPDTVPEVPLPRWDYVIDSEEATGIIRVTNHPLGEGIVFARAFLPPDTFPVPVIPGESIRFMPDGTLGTPGNILVDEPPDAAALIGAIVDIGFEVWNLGPVPAEFIFTPENADGWPMWLSEPVAMIPPMTPYVIIVSTEVVAPSKPSNMIVLRAQDMADPTQTHWASCYVEVELPPTAADRTPPAEARLHQCRPNPFNPSTEIPFELPRRAEVSIDIFDAAGRYIATAVNAVFGEGYHTVPWNGRDARGAAVASGVYFYRLDIEDGTSLVRKMVLLR